MQHVTKGTGMQAHYTRVLAAASVPAGAAGAEGTSNTPPQFTLDITTGQYEGIDWLSLHMPGECRLDLWATLIGEREWEEERGSGTYHYDRRRTCTELPTAVLYSEHWGGDGSLLVLPATALRQLEAEGIVTDWQRFAATALALGCMASRLDWFRDDVDTNGAGLVNLEAIRQAKDDRALTTRWREFYRFPGMGREKMHSGELLADGVNLGRRGSSAYCRFYDKRLEQAGELRADARERFLAGIAHWIRCELELHRGRAQAALEALAAHGAAWFAPVLRSYLDFKARPIAPRENRSRVPIAPWWEKFLAAVPKWRLVEKKPLQTLGRIFAHFIYQYGPLLAACQEAWGNAGAWLPPAIADSRERLRKRHHKLIEAEAHAWEDEEWDRAVRQVEKEAAGHARHGALERRRDACAAAILYYWQLHALRGASFFLLWLQVKQYRARA